MEKLANCPSCGSININSIKEIKDYSVSNQNFNLDICQECSLIFTNPRPDITEIGKYYQSDEYISHSDTKEGLINKIYHAVREITLKSKLDLINKLSPAKGMILDVGCGTGYFLNKCKSNGWEVKGTEPDEKARALASTKTSSEISKSIQEIEPDEKFEIITLWHVLEHIHSLKEDLKLLISKLKPGGKIIIAVPNPTSYDAHYYQNYWAAWDVPRHLYHFNPGAMKTLLKLHGLKIKEIKPMKFDSVYVSMLSEKYKTGSQNLIKALYIGLKSNALAKPDKYSSLIYVAEKSHA